MMDLASLPQLALSTQDPHHPRYYLCHLLAHVHQLTDACVHPTSVLDTAAQRRPQQAICVSEWESQTRWQVFQESDML